MKKIIWFIFFQTLSVSVFPQKGTIVQGVVSDSLGAPLYGADVRLISLPDSSLLRATATDRKGLYEFDRVMPGRYLLAVKSIGYHSFFGLPFSVTSEIVEYNVSLKKGSTLLEEVKIADRQTGVAVEPGKVVLNVDKDILASGGNVFDVLKRAPGVGIGTEGAIQIRGREGVAIVIDGRMLNLSPADLSETLKSMSADLVEKIEVNSSPSAAYDASGRGGVISIKLKKARNEGTNGSLVLAGGLGENYKMNSSAVFNHRNKRVNLFGSISAAGNRRADRYEMNRLVQFNPGNSDFDINNYDLKSFKNLNVKAGIDVNVGKKQTIGILYTGLHNRMRSVETNNTSVYASSAPDSAIRTFSDEHRWVSNDAINVNYKTELSGKSSLSLDADYLKYGRRSEESLVYNFLDSRGSLYKDLTGLINKTPSDISVFSVKGDYALTLHDYSLTAGFKSSWVSNSNERQVYNAGDAWVSKAFGDDNSDFKENIQAGYVSISREYSKKVRAEIGLRGEYTESSSSSLLEEGYNKKYFDIFPSLNLGVELSKDHMLSVLYARRIARPAYDDLNPFRYFLDVYTYRDGNPDLRPEYSHNIELSDVYKEKLTATFSFTHVKDYYVTFTEQDDATGVSRSSKRNLSFMRGWGLELAYDASLAAWLSSTLDAQGYLQRFELGTAGNAVKNGAYWSFSSVNAVRLKHSFNSQVVFKYESPIVSGMYNFKSGYTVDLGLAKSVQNKKGALRLSVSDVFNSDRERYSSNLPVLVMRARQKNETRYVVLSYTYKFGSKKDSGTARDTGNDTERKRISN